MGKLDLLSGTGLPQMAYAPPPRMDIIDPGIDAARAFEEDIMRVKLSTFACGAKAVRLLICVLALAIWPRSAHASTNQSGEPAETSGVIVLSYLSEVDQSIRNSVFDDLFRVRWPTECRCDRREDAIEQIILKTSYYLYDVKHALEQLFPDASVVIQPGALIRNEFGDISYEIQNPEVPAAVRIDFLAAVSAEVAPHAPSFASTHGHYFQPAYVVRATMPEGSPLILYSKGLSVAAYDTGDQPSVLKSIISAPTKKSQRKGVKELEISTKARKFKEDIWVAHTSSEDGAPQLAQSFVEDDLRPWQVQLAAALQSSIVTAPEFARYRALYADASISSDPVIDELVPQFASAEASLLEEMSDSTLAVLRAGDFGQSVRQLLLAERDANRTAGTTSWLSAAAMVAGGFGTASSSALSNYVMYSSYQQQMKSMLDTFDYEFDGLERQQAERSIEFGNQQVVVQANSVSELRSQFREILAKFSQ